MGNSEVTLNFKIYIFFKYKALLGPFFWLFWADFTVADEHQLGFYRF